MARHPGAAFMLVGLLAVDPENRDAINLRRKHSPSSARQISANSRNFYVSSAPLERDAR